MLRKILPLLLCPVLLYAADTTSPSPEESLQKLKEGNLRFVNNKMNLCDSADERREALKEHQTPFAAILGCSDSRVSPEIIFDQNIGDLFIVRVAGNVFGPVPLDSIEYGTAHLGAQLVVVLGHEGCGAIGAVLSGNSADIPTLESKITPAIKGLDKNDLEGAIKANVRYVINELNQSPVIQKLVKEKKLEVVGAYYHFKDGTIDWL